MLTISSIFILFPLFLSLQALAGDGRLFSRVTGLLNTQPMLQLDYTATDRAPETLPVDESQLQETGVSIAQWDPISPPPGHLTSADLLVCNCSVSIFENPAEILSNLAATVKEGGFVLLHTLLKGETLGEIISFLTSPDLQQRGLLAQVNSWPFQTLLMFALQLALDSTLLHTESQAVHFIEWLLHLILSLLRNV